MTRMFLARPSREAGVSRQLPPICWHRQATPWQYISVSFLIYYYQTSSLGLSLQQQKRSGCCTCSADLEGQLLAQSPCSYMHVACHEGKRHRTTKQLAWHHEISKYKWSLVRCSTQSPTFWLVWRDASCWREGCFSCWLLPGVGQQQPYSQTMWEEKGKCKPVACLGFTPTQNRKPCMWGSEAHSSRGLNKHVHGLGDRKLKLKQCLWKTCSIYSWKKLLFICSIYFSLKKPQNRGKINHRSGPGCASV